MINRNIGNDENRNGVRKLRIDIDLDIKVRCPQLKDSNLEDGEV